MQPDEPTSQAPRIFNPSLSCLSGLSTVSQGEAREESMPEKAGLKVLQAKVERSVISHLVSLGSGQSSLKIGSEQSDGNIFAAGVWGVV